jgi:hypothetical protein
MVYTYNVGSSTATFDGNDDGSMTIIGSGSLTQNQVNTAITSYSDSGKTVSLPSTVLIAGTFTSLDERAFYNTKFTSIKFSEESQVTTISTLTFQYCSSMTSLSLPPTLTTILSNMCESCSKLETIFIPATVTSIGSQTFEACSKLHTVTFGPDSKLTGIGRGVFRSCHVLARIEFPERFTSWSGSSGYALGMFGHNGGASIRAMKLNRSIFNTFSSGNYAVLPNVPTGFRRLITFYGEDPIIYENPSGQTLNIVVDQYAYEQVMDIAPSPYTGSMSLYGKGELTQAQVNAAIDQHGIQYAGQSLQEVQIGSEFTSLGGSAFQSTKFTSINFSEDSQVTEMSGNRTFSHSNLMTSIFLPPKLTSTPYAMCQHCTKLETILVPATVTSLGSLSFANCDTLHTAAFGPESKLIKMEFGVFYNSNAIVRIEFPESLTSYSDEGYGSFGQHSAGKSIRVMRMNRSIFDKFNAQNRTVMVAVPTGFRRLITFYGEDPIIYDNPSGQILDIVVDQYAYEQVMDITPSPYTGSMSLYGKGSLTAAQVTAAMSQHGQQFPGNDQPLNEITIGSDFTSVANDAFYRKNMLQSIVFEPGSKVTTMESNVFQECTALTFIAFPELLKSIGGSAVNSSNAIRTMKMNRSIWTTVLANLTTTSNTQVVSFYEDPVYYTVIDSNLVPGTGITYDNGTFNGLYDGTLSIVGTGTLPRSVIDAFITINGSKLGLTINVDKTITSLGDGIFAGHTGLTEVHFPVDSTLEALSAHCFQGCTSLKTMVVPPRVTTFGAQSFQECSSLTNLTFPLGLTTGEIDVFDGATGLRIIKLERKLWESSFKSSLPENIGGFKQLVHFYGKQNIVEALETKRDLLQVDDSGGYQKVIDYYSDRDTFTIDRTGGTTELVEIGIIGVNYDVATNSISGPIYEGILTIVGTGGELTQSIVDTAIGSHTTALDGTNRPLHTLIVGDKFTSLSSSLSLKGTGITCLEFPAESPITTTGLFELGIDSTLDTFVVLPKWVTQ